MYFGAGKTIITWIILFIYGFGIRLVDHEPWLTNRRVNGPWWLPPRIANETAGTCKRCWHDAGAAWASPRTEMCDFFIYLYLSNGSAKAHTASWERVPSIMDKLSCSHQSNGPIWHPGAEEISAITHKPSSHGQTGGIERTTKKTFQRLLVRPRGCQCSVPGGSSSALSDQIGSCRHRGQKGSVKSDHLGEHDVIRSAGSAAASKDAFKAAFFE